MSEVVTTYYVVMVKWSVTQCERLSGSTDRVTFPRRYHQGLCADPRCETLHPRATIEYWRPKVVGTTRSMPAFHDTANKARAALRRELADVDFDARRDLDPNALRRDWIPRRLAAEIQVLDLADMRPLDATTTPHEIFESKGVAYLERAERAKAAELAALDAPRPPATRLKRKPNARGRCRAEFSTENSDVVWLCNAKRGHTGECTYELPNITPMVTTASSAKMYECRPCGGSGDADYFRQDNASGPGTPGPTCRHCGGTGNVQA